MDAASRLTVIGLTLGEKPAIISAIVKYHLTDRMQKCVIDSMIFMVVRVSALDRVIMWGV